MQIIRSYWNAFRNFAIMFSFIMNFVLVIILLFLVKEIFMIKNGIAEPLIDGLHSNFVGLDEARIQTDIYVDDTMPIDFILPLKQTTNVVIQEPVPLEAQADIVFPGGGGSLRATVFLDLPPGLTLPVALDLDVPVQQTIPVQLTVPVDIPLAETQLHTPFNNMRYLLDPYVRVLDNLPSDWDEVRPFAGDVIGGKVNLLRPTAASQNPWPGHEVAAPGEDTGETTTDETGTQPPVQPGDSGSIEGSGAAGEAGTQPPLPADSGTGGEPAPGTESEITPSARPTILPSPTAIEGEE